MQINKWQRGVLIYFGAMIVVAQISYLNHHSSAFGWLGFAAAGAAFFMALKS